MPYPCDAMKIGIIGTGNVGSALGRGWAQAGHEVVFGSRTPERASVPEESRVLSQAEAALWAEVVVLAVPYRALQETLEAVGPENFNDKVVLDVTNVLAVDGGLAVGHTTSGAEELAKLLPGANVVKAFNTVFAQNMAGRVGEEPLSLFVAGDDPTAKRTVQDLGKNLGFEPVDAGPLSSARYLEPMGMQLIALGYRMGMGPAIGYRLVQGEP